MKIWLMAVLLTILAMPLAAQEKNEAIQRELRRAISRDDIEGVRAALDAGADVNAPNQWGNTPLHLAAFLDRGPIASLLLQRGAKADAVNPNGVTPLQAIERRGGGNVAGILIHSGKVDFGLAGENGDTPLQSATKGRDWWAVLDYLRQDKLFFERHEVITKALAWAEAPQFGRTLQACLLAVRALDIPAMLRAGTVSIEGSAANRPLAEIFDDDRSVPVETSRLNPFVVALTFQQPQTVTGFFIMANKRATPVHRHRWKVESAATPEDLAAKAGSYAEATPWVQPADEEPSALILPRPVQARCFRLTVERLEKQNDVYLTQFRLLTEGEPYALSYEPTVTLEKPQQGIAEPQPMDVWQADTRWDGERQLLWRDIPVSAELKFSIPVPISGRYEVHGRFTKAPDYGIIEPQLDGTKLGKSIDLFANQIMPTEEINLGTLNLEAGQHTFALRVTGKNPKSRANSAGIDTLRLIPAR